MSSPKSLRCVISAAATFVLMLAGAGAARADEKTPAPVEALIYSTMPSTPAHCPTMAMDGDPDTYFRSVYGMDDGDTFLVLLGQPIPVQSIRITTGDPDGNDALTNGFVETSPDAATYAKAATFDDKGVAEATLDNVPVTALRIRLNPRSGIPALLIREIVITSPVKITHVQMGPGRGFHDLSQVPDLSQEPNLAAWAQKAESQMEAFWPDTAAILYSDKFISPNMINVVYRTGPRVTGVAATGGGVMTVNTKWCHQHPEDTGLTVHETAHVIQAYKSYNPVWLVEGIADYIRWVRFEPANNHARIDVQKATYHDSYRTTAVFLGWCELHYDSRLVTKLNQDVRYDHYKKDLFLKYCGKDVDALWAEFIAAYQADPAHIITPAVAPEDRPRVLPVVAAGTSQPVALGPVFDTIGFTDDGAKFDAGAAFDGGGAAYSSKLLGTSPTWKNVKFNLGPANASDVLGCHGNVIALPAGQYSSLWLLGSAIQGHQLTQAFTVTYDDGTKENLLQNMSDWFQPEGFPGESRAVKMPYRNMADGTREDRTFYAYSYGFNLNPAKTVKSITLPDNQYVKILAITLAN